MNAVKGGGLGPGHRNLPIKKGAARVAHGTRFLPGQEGNRAVDLPSVQAEFGPKQRDVPGDLHRPVRDCLCRLQQRCRDFQLRSVW